MPRATARLIRVLLVSTGIFAATSVAAQPTRELSRVSVSGSAEIKVVPDEIHFHVGVETRNEDLDRAKKENDERVAQVIKFARSVGVEEKDIQTDFVGVEPYYETDRSRAKPVGYAVQRGVGIKLRRIGNFEPLLTGLIKNGANHVQGIDFRTSELRKHRDAARSLAIRAAREKADALAKDLGMTRGKALQINDTYGGGWWSGVGGFRGGRSSGMQQNVLQAGGGAGDAAEAGLTIGQISVTATVSVTFLIE